jgi:methionyl aminopeptidase
MIIIKNKRSIEYMRQAGHALARIFKEFESLDMLKAGLSTHAVDAWFEKQMRSNGLHPECKGYAGYKHATCISVNDVVVHGVPSEKLILSEGDKVSIDVVGSFKGYCADMARSYIVGNSSAGVAFELIKTAQAALDKGISKIAPGVLLAEVVYEIQTTVEAQGFGVVRRFAGHGIGRSLHEEPDVPNYVEGTDEIVLREGMTFAIEPMITEGNYDVKIMSDGWTAKTVDGKLAAHVEDTVVVTATGYEILTRL